MSYQKPSVWTNRGLIQDLESKGVNVYKQKTEKIDYIVSILMTISLILIPILTILICFYSVKVGK